MSFGTNPASTAALEAPTAQCYFPRTLASSYKILKFSPFFIPLPPETTYLAEPNSTISDSDTLFSNHFPLMFSL